VRFLSKKNSLLIIFISTTLILSGFSVSQNLFAEIQDLYKNQLRKLMNVIHLAQLYYVEEIDWNEAIEGAISGMLEKMDPHSVYIPEEKVRKNKENFSGKYEGVGIKFDIIEDQITVISPIQGSPSEQVGILPGDRIVKIDGKTALGLDTEEVLKRLRGPRGSRVHLSVIRANDDLIEFSVEREVIPIRTVTTNFKTDDSTGYILVNRFAATTSTEIEEALANLEEKNIERLILDLRNNPGGYLHEAVKVAGKFIRGHKLIVYTQDRSGETDEEYYSDQFGKRTVRDYPIIVLINSGSASASEIVAGAIQDYDRGLIVGNNSFGKGLVQKEFNLQDGSAVRITTAKYFTPLGRSIQREYKNKRLEEYYSELEDYHPDESVLAKRPLYITKRLGRSLYGGGGIMPDIEVEINQFSEVTKTTKRLLQNRIFFQFAQTKITEDAKKFKSVQQFLKASRFNHAYLEKFMEFCQRKRIEIDSEDVVTDKEFLCTKINAAIAKKIWGIEGYYFFMLHNDNQFLTAMQEFGIAAKLAMINR